MATWAIGDVHGCWRTLVALFERLAFDRARDRLWLVGDLVNRGPRSLDVLRWARGLDAALGERMAVVLGNHDGHLLALAAGVGGARPDLVPILEAPDADELVAWLRGRPLLVSGEVEGRGQHLLIHAGLLPDWTAGVAAERARRAERVLRGADGPRRLLAWANEAGGADPLDEARETFSVLTRLRMLDERGAPCSHAGAPEDAPAGCVAWFERPDRATRGGPVVVAGHWAALGHRQRPDLVALDSGCVYGGALTAVRLEDRAVVSEPNREGEPG